MVTVEIGQGEAVKVILRDTDGGFVLNYGADEPNRLYVHADIPDDTNRQGVIYEGTWDPSEVSEVDVPEEADTPCGFPVVPNPPNMKGITTTCSLWKGHEGDHIDHKGTSRANVPQNTCGIRNPTKRKSRYCVKCLFHVGNHEDAWGKQWS